MSTVQGTDEVLVNRNNETYTQPQSTLMANLEKTDLLLVNRSDETYTVSGEDFISSVVDPISLNVSINPSSPTIGQEVTAIPIVTGGKAPAGGFVYTYQWYIADDAAGTNATEIAGATTDKYTPLQTQDGKYLGCKITTTDFFGDSIEDTSYAGPIATIKIRPDIDSVALTEVYDSVNRYTSKDFPFTTTMSTAGTPDPDYKLKVKLSGATFNFGVMSDVITNVENNNTKLTVNSENDLSLLTGDVVMTDGTGSSPTQTGYKLITADIESITQTDRTATIISGTITNGSIDALFNTPSDSDDLPQAGLIGNAANVVVDFPYPLTGVLTAKINSGSSDYLPGGTVTLNTGEQITSPYVGAAELSFGTVTNATRFTMAGTGARAGGVYLHNFKLDGVFVQNGTQNNLTFVGDLNGNPDLKYFKVDDVVQNTDIKILSNGYDNGDNEMSVLGGSWYADPAKGGDGSGDSSGDTHVEYQTDGGQGTISSVNTTEKTVTLTSTGGRDNRWIANDNKSSTPFYIIPSSPITDSKTTAYGIVEQTNGNIEIKGIQKTDPAFVDITAKDGTIKFPATFGTGNPPDTDLPNGVSITATVFAENTEGDDEQDSNTLLPQAPNPAGSIGPITASTETTITAQTAANIDGLTASDRLMMVDNTGAKATYELQTSNIDTFETVNGNQTKLTFTGDVADNKDLKFFRTDDVVQSSVDWDRSANWSQNKDDSRLSSNTSWDFAFDGAALQELALTNGPIVDKRVETLELPKTISGDIDIWASKGTTTSGQTGSFIYFLDANDNIVLTYNLNGVPSGSASWQGVQNTTTQIKKIRISDTSSTQFSSIVLQAVKVNGKRLVNSDITDPNDVKVVSTGLSESPPTNTMIVTGGNWDTSNQSQVWSSGTSDGNTYDHPTRSYGWENAFNGITATSTGAGNAAYTENADGSTYTFPSGVSISGNVRVFVGSGTQTAPTGGGIYLYDENDSQSAFGLYEDSRNVDASWVDLGAVTGVKKIKMTQLLGIMAVEVDGKVLVDAVDDSRVWSANVTNENTGAPANKAFTGNISTSNYWGNNGSASILTLDPGLDIENKTIVIYGAAVSDGDILVNDVAISGLPGSTNTLTPLDITNALSGETELTKIEVRANSAYLQGVTVDGKILVDQGADRNLGQSKVTYTPPSGSATFDSASGAVLTVNSSNNRWISNDNRLGTDFYVAKDLGRGLDADNPADVQIYQDIVAAFDAFPVKVNQRRTGIASSLYRLMSGEAVSAAELSVLEDTVLDAVNAQEPFALDGYYPLYYTSDKADAASSAGTHHVHTIDGIEYYMPDGGTLYHGTYTS